MKANNMDENDCSWPLQALSVANKQCVNFTTALCLDHMCTLLSLSEPHCAWLPSILARIYILQRCLLVGSMVYHVIHDNAIPLAENVGEFVDYITE